jgi:hypothetical protein
MIRFTLIAVAAVFLVTYNSAPSLGSAENTITANSVVSSAEIPMASGTTSLSVNLAPNAQIDQIAIVDVLSYNGSKPTITAPDGWRLIRDDSSLTTRQSLYWHRVAANEPTTASWTFSEPVDAQGAILLLDNVASDSQVDNTSGNTDTGGTLTARSVANTAAGDLILAFYATDFWGTGLGPTMPDNVDTVLNYEAPREYWILATYQSQNGSTSDAACPTAQLFNGIAAQVAIERGNASASPQ